MDIQKVRGTKDFVEVEAKNFDYIVKTAKEVFEKYNYKLIITPIFENTNLFLRSIGEDTDIVSKEMYTFDDKGGRSITLRPEGTAPVVRSYLENKIYGTEENTKYYYIGPMYRYEKPQAGRYREFFQLGIESFGEKSPAMDAEVIIVGYNLLKKLEINDIKININSIGGNDSRKIYKKELINFLENKKDNLCIDCQKKMYLNPLRVFDCKVKSCKNTISRAPLILDFLSENELIHFNKVKSYLNAAKVPYIINPKLVRGLDYYTSTVFEIISESLGSQGTVIGGGRYDNLVKIIGDKDIPAVGFGAGIERIMMLLPKISNKKSNIYIAWLDENSLEYAINVSELLRNNNKSVYIDYKKKSLNGHLKKAGKLECEIIIIIGDNEVENNSVTIKNYKTRKQIEVKYTNIIDEINKMNLIGGSLCTEHII